MVMRDVTENWMCGFQRVRWKNPIRFPVTMAKGDPPVLLPNTEVKPFSADGTWLETTWESRTLPDSMKRNTCP